MVHLQSVFLAVEPLFMVVILIAMTTCHGPVQKITINNITDGLYCAQGPRRRDDENFIAATIGQVAAVHWLPGCTCLTLDLCQDELDVLLSQPSLGHDEPAPILVAYGGCLTDLAMDALSTAGQPVFLRSAEPLNETEELDQALLLSVENASLAVSLPTSVTTHLCPAHVHLPDGCQPGQRGCPVIHYDGYLPYPPPLWLLGNGSSDPEEPPYIMTWPTNNGIRGRHLIVTTIEWAPFVIRTVRNGSVVYSGLCHDLFAELVKEHGFSYTLVEPTDPNTFGVNIDGNWTGVVGQVARREVDLLVGPITVDSNRDKVVDFTSSIYFDYTVILMRTPDPSERKYRVLVDPFQGPVWLSLIFSIPFMAITLFVIARASDKIRSAATFQPTPVVTPSEQQKHLITSRNTRARFPSLYWWEACWIVFGSGFTQGCVCPWLPAARVVFWSWLAFIIIVSATYTGNLVATLTVPLAWVPFTSLDDLITQTRFTWGTVGGTYYHDLFEKSTTMPYTAIWEGIDRVRRSDPAALSDNLTVLLDKVRGGDFALIYEKSTLMTPALTCDMMLAREHHLPVQFAFVLQEGSPYTKPISDSILRMREVGMIRRWERQYWPVRNKCIVQKLETEPVSLGEIQGAFYVLAAGLALAVMVGCCEGLYTYLYLRNSGQTDGDRSQATTEEDVGSLQDEMYTATSSAFIFASPQYGYT